ncbi:hypothetical protein M427DRAFT_295299 [Gonapodya prolifera JEL478]|uniref:Uncharacterized protein n=1 Tax=Gonapodya prolifera (strain JEL478) TaxID=1344416 RepID=A0A139AIM2_GONPJ|nr:hypothetical protein M427DRAFT_295299 [Gonapodya prolifera JEL478]|eukprot:KXS16255.1 hypothetical protein M427DRAFT_295299 [Gonapodya prolifera JEL478]
MHLRAICSQTRHTGFLSHGVGQSLGRLVTSFREVESHLAYVPPNESKLSGDPGGRVHVTFEDTLEAQMEMENYRVHDNTIGLSYASKELLESLAEIQKSEITLMEQMAFLEGLPDGITRTR